MEVLLSGSTLLTKLALSYPWLVMVREPEGQGQVLLNPTTNR